MTRNAAGAILFSAIRRQQIQMHRGAEPGDVNVLLTHTSQNKLVPVRARNIEA